MTLITHRQKAQAFYPLSSTRSSDRRRKRRASRALRGRSPGQKEARPGLANPWREKNRSVEESEKDSDGPTDNVSSCVIGLYWMIVEIKVAGRLGDFLCTSLENLMNNVDKTSEDTEPSGVKPLDPRPPGSLSAFDSISPANM